MFKVTTFSNEVDCKQDVDTNTLLSQKQPEATLSSVLLCFVQVCSSGTTLQQQVHDNQLICIIIMSKGNSVRPINIRYPYPYLYILGGE